MKIPVLFFVLLTSISTLASGQLISVGVKGGIPFANPTAGNDESPPYVVGPSVEVRLPAGFAIEAEALYRRIGNTNPFGVFGANIAVSAGLSSLVLPPVDTRYRGN